MIQRRSRSCFTLESFYSFRIVSQFLWKKLQSYPAVKFDVLRLVDHAHATTTDDLQNPIMGDSLADQVGSDELRGICDGGSLRLHRAQLCPLDGHHPAISPARQCFDKSRLIRRIT